MKLFDPRAELAKIQNQRGTPANPANSANPEGETRPHLAEIAELAAPPPEIPKADQVGNFPSCPAPNRPTADPTGTTSPGGRPVTWTGTVVSLGAWRAMSDWERHGPREKTWCGQRNRWVDT